MLCANRVSPDQFVHFHGLIRVFSVWQYTIITQHTGTDRAEQMVS